MAENPKTVGKSDVQYAEDYLNIQKELDNIYKSQAANLLSHATIQKSLSRGVIDNLRQTLKLRKDVERTYREEQKIRDDLKIVGQHETARRALLNTQLKSIILQRKEMQQELDILGKIRTQGLIPILWAAHRVWSLFETLDSAAWKFRETMGLTRETSDMIRQDVQKIYVETMHLGVAIGGVYDAWMAVGKEMGSVHIVNKDLARTTAILKSQLGVAEENSAGFMRNMAAISGTAMKTQENMAYTAILMAQAAGVPLNVVMGDVGKASGHTLTMMSRLPGQVLKAAVELRRMGTSLKESSNASREILNFTDSIQAEMEASVLLGRSINLQHARELAYKRDIEGSTKEILRITKQIGFEGLDVFQQEAFARATGRSVDELLRMIQADKEWAAARRSTDPELRKMVERYEQLRIANKATVLSETERLKIMVQQRANQERMASITAKWNQLVAKVARVFLPIIDNVLGFVVEHFEDIAKGMSWMLLFGKQIGNLIVSIGKQGAALGTRIENIALWFGKWFPSLGKVSVALAWIGEKVGAIFGWVTKLGTKFNAFGAVLGRILQFFPKVTSLFSVFGRIGGWITKILFKIGGGILGKIAVPLIFVWNIFKRFKEGWSEIQNMGYWAGVWHLIKKLGLAIWDTFNDFFFGLPGLILTGLKSVWNWIADAIPAAFKKAKDGIKEWLGFSPSGIGLSIVKGIIAIGPMIFDALTAPFRKGLAWITDKIPGMGKIAAKLRGGATEMIGKPVESRIASTYVPAVTVTPTGTRIANNAVGAKPTAAGTDEGTFATDKTLQDILAAINALNANLSNGKIGIYLDGQLVSATLARQTEFRGGYGVNKY